MRSATTSHNLAPKYALTRDATESQACHCEVVGSAADWRSQNFTGHAGVMQKPEMPPEGRLIRDAVKRSGVSMRKTALEAGLSDTRLRQIVNGYQPAGGQYIPVVAPAETIARIATVVGVGYQQLVAAGRQDAADVLAELSRVRSVRQHPSVVRGHHALEMWLQSDRLESPPREGLELWPDADLTEEVLRRMTSRMDLVLRLTRARREEGEPDAGQAEDQKNGLSRGDYTTAASRGANPGKQQRKQIEHNQEADQIDPPGPEGGA